MLKDKYILSLNLYRGELAESVLSYVAQARQKAAVMCFQEADGPIHDEIDLLLTDSYQGYFMEKTSPDGTHYRLVTYVERGIKVLGAGEVLEGVEGGGAGLSCIIELSSDRRLQVVNVHGVPEPGDKLDNPVRLSQSEELLRVTDSSLWAQVVMGDFNLDPETRSVKVFEESGFLNLIKDYNIATTRNRVAWENYPDNPQLYADYVFLRGDDVQVDDFHVEDVVVSDHLPMWLKLDKKD